MGSRILLVADAPSSPVAAQLAQSGYAVDSAGDIDRAERLVRERTPALAIVHIEDRDGLDLIRSLRESVPVVAVCAAHATDLTIGCLDAGADTVLIVPLSRLELTARVHALLARNAASAPVRAEAYVLRGLVIDAEAHTVTKAGRAIDLTPTEFRLLVALARRAGQVVTHAALRSELWDTPHLDGPQDLRLYIHYIRQKLEDDPRKPRLLLCERGVGYRLAIQAPATNGRTPAWQATVPAPVPSR